MSANKTTRRLDTLDADVHLLGKSLAKLVKAHNDFVAVIEKASEKQRGAMVAIINRLEEIAPSQTRDEKTGAVVLPKATVIER